MDLSLESIIIKVVAENHCSVGFVSRIIIRRIIHCTRVVDLRTTVPRRCIQLGMLVITFLRSMKHLIIGM